MHTCEATGKTIEQAIQNALLELKAAREDVDIKILSEGGFLKKAKVVVSISEDAIEKYEKKEQFKKSLAAEEEKEVVMRLTTQGNEEFQMSVDEWNKLSEEKKEQILNQINLATKAMTMQNMGNVLHLLR